MNELLISFGVPVLTGLLAYLGARYQGKNELEKLRMQQSGELELLKEKANHDLEKLEREMKSQADLHERNTQTDLSANFLGKMFEGNPTDMIDSLKKLQELSEAFGGTQNNRRR